MRELVDCNCKSLTSDECIVPSFVERHPCIYEPDSPDQPFHQVSLVLPLWLEPRTDQCRVFESLSRERKVMIV